MLQLTDHLSVWELAHRWHYADPNLSNPQSLPLEIQDTIRFLCRGLVNCEMSVSTANGIVLKNPANAVDFDSYIEINVEENYESLTSEEQEKIDSEYDDYINNFGHRHIKLVEDLEKVYAVRQYDKNALENAHIDQICLLQYCETKEVMPPKFWFTDEQLNQFSEGGYNDVVKGTRTQPEIDAFWGSLNHKQKARLMTREIAQIMWSENPDLTIC